MSYAVLFSGQGTQHPGMLPWLESHAASQPTLKVMEGVLGTDWRHALQDARTRSPNAFAQPLIVGTSVAAWAALASQLGEPPVAVAGYSVGELAAFACAGVFTAEAALRLAVRRAAHMDAAVAGLQTGLLSVSGLHLEQVLQSVRGLECAIHIGAGQGIYAGERALLLNAAQALTQQGAVCKLLEISVASHSSWMASAAQAFARDLVSLDFARPRPAVVLNASGTSTRDPQTLRTALHTQIASTVQWAACMDTLAEQGVACVLEVGAGTTLSKMWNQRHPQIPARALEDFRDAAGAAGWVQKVLE